MIDKDKFPEEYKVAKMQADIVIEGLFSRLENELTQYILQGFEHTTDLHYMYNELFEMAEDFHCSANGTSSWRDR